MSAKPKKRSTARPQRLVDPRKADALLYAARDYLQEIGWTALVGSIDRIQQDPLAARATYELVIKFTGGKSDEQERNEL